MKKIFMLLAVAGIMSSCGGGSYCDCAKEATTMATEAGTDADKAKAAAEKAAECAAMLEGKSEEEVAEMMKDCK